MGALTRETRKELAECAADPEWWPDVFSEIYGGKTLKTICEERSWAYSETLRTIRADGAVSGLNAQYEDARRGMAEYDVDAARDMVRTATLETMPLVKMQSEFGLKLAGKLDRARYADRAEVGGGGGIQVIIDRSCGGAVMVGVKDAGGNSAALLINGTEAAIDGGGG